jgi:hypothetical protein
LSGFSSSGHGTSSWHGESGSVEFARHSPPRAQYEGQRSCSFELVRSYGPRSSFRGFRAPLARREWFPHGGFNSSGDGRMGPRFGAHGRFDAHFGMNARMDHANPTLE